MGSFDSMENMILEAKERGVKADDLFEPTLREVDPQRFFDVITNDLSESYKKAPFTRIKLNKKGDQFYDVLLAYLDSAGTGKRDYKKLEAAAVQSDIHFTAMKPVDGRHRAAFCILLGIKLPVKEYDEKYRWCGFWS